MLLAFGEALVDVQNALTSVVAFSDAHVLRAKMGQYGVERREPRRICHRGSAED